MLFASFDAGFDWYLNELEKKEKETGMLGGFAVPMSVDDPTGEKRRAAAASATSASASLSPSSSS